MDLYTILALSYTMKRVNLFGHRRKTKLFCYLTKTPLGKQLRAATGSGKILILSNDKETLSGTELNGAERNAELRSTISDCKKS